ncbi:Phosphatidic acid phosphatase type 2 domain containing [Chamberlinius hualienensis]
MDEDHFKCYSEFKPPRKLPGWLLPLVFLDKYLSSWLAICASKSSTFGRLRQHMKVLEISCHGIPWIAGCIGAMFIFTNSDSQQLLVNILIGLLLDCFFVAVIKAAVRRGRPAENANDMFATISLDGYSFPSGHASRAVLLFLIFHYKCELAILYISTLGLWSIFVCLSRILLARHHISDVLFGCALGYLEFRLLRNLWIGPEGTKFVLSLFDVEQGY